MNKEDELLKKCSYVVISSYRRKVLETLEKDVKIPTKISIESGVGIKHVSNVLTDLKEHNLIVCINEDAHKGRLYRLTDEGQEVLSMITKMDW
ncbi:winged helix-turn-helix domain-containing protein [uncultured Methanobrevibacter sp.]|uniref:winged helix-turn-helix domain-containing protein n=1 Tax=uncultured Methanobrevibacter sp. TaxID=253161 RepID=UPI0026054BBF|nr:winged helix-turn-helix domain-containing protein [uncultured Methanobrevibacter sp.]